jgi:beta-N-acetylhexosaminidase
VDKTFARLSEDDRIRQLFVLRSAGEDADELARQQAFRPGGITRVMGPDVAAERALIAAFNAAAPVPLTVSADLEGSRMSLPFGTQLPNPLALAAVDDPATTADICRILAEEAHAAGYNWSLTPQMDINAAFRSAIVATRGYGSDVATIERHAVAQIEAFQHAGIAATAKHFPGEGFDDRDQHLVTTINPLPVEEWEATFGRLYRAAIDVGVMAVMSAHIAFPAFVRAIDPDAGADAFKPASINPILNTQLLRRRLGFGGLIVSDASEMGGLAAWSSRADYLPQVIASGCDVILFSNEPEDDHAIIAKALADSRLPRARFEDAVRRNLAFKAALGLHTPRVLNPAEATTTPEKTAIAEAVIRRAPTLVKDVPGTLPLDPTKHRRVLVVTPGIVHPFGAIPFIVPELLAQRGFEVTMFTPDQPIRPAEHDLMLYLFGEETLLTRSHIFIDWMKLHGDLGKAMNRYWHDVPTVMVSFGYPYLLYDAPRVPTYINAYMTAEPMQRAVVAALCGDIPFNRHSPVDPFCGLEDARF